MSVDRDEDGWTIADWERHGLEWQQAGSVAVLRMEAAEQKLARIAVLFSDDVWWGMSDQKIRRKVLAIIDGSDV